MTALNCLKAFKMLTIHNRSSVVIARSYKRWVSPTLTEIERRKRKMGPQPLIRRSTFLEWNQNAEIYAFGIRLREQFDEQLLKRAFTHRSYILQEEQLQREAGIENPELSIPDNRILITRGEQFMSSYVKDFLVSSLPNFPQDAINKAHDYLLSDDVLSTISSYLGTTDIILCAEFPVEKSILSDTLKAILGALIESSGNVRAGEFVKDFIMTQLSDKDVNDFVTQTDPMETLTELLRSKNRAPPEPRLINEAGKNTILAVFRVGIYSDKKLIAIGSGETIKIAIEMAAFESLKELYGTPNNMAPFKFNTPNIRTHQNLQQ